MCASVPAVAYWVSFVDENINPVATVQATGDFIQTSCLVLRCTDTANAVIGKVCIEDGYYPYLRVKGGLTNAVQ